MNRPGFHHRALARTYAGYNEVEFDYLVTSDGEVYHQYGKLFFSGKNYAFKYDAKSKREGSWYEFPLDDAAAERVKKKFVGSWTTLEAAKAEADKLAANLDKNLPPTVTTAGGDVITTPPAKSGPNVGAAIGIGVAAVALVAGTIIIARRNKNVG